MTACDAEIRPFLRQRLEQLYAGEKVILIDEFPLHGGDIRADIVAMNGSLHGYEIKSDRDTLDRLPRQVGAYSGVFDRASIVVSEKHLKPARLLLPEWWEILLVQCVGGGVCFKCLRRSKPNPSRQGMALASLLWKAEALSLLTSLGLDSGMRAANMSEIMDRLVENVPVKELAHQVRHKLLARGDWLSASRQKRDGEKSQPHATRARRRRTLYSRTVECTRLPN